MSWHCLPTRKAKVPALVPSDDVIWPPYQIANVTQGHGRQNLNPGRVSDADVIFQPRLSNGAPLVVDQDMFFAPLAWAYYTATAPLVSAPDAIFAPRLYPVLFADEVLDGARTRAGCAP